MPPTELAGLSEHIAALVKLDRQMLEEQISLERQQTIAEPPKAGETVATRTAHWMNGYAAAGPLGMSKGERLHAIRLDREGIRLALSHLEQQRQRHLAIQEAAEAKARLPQWDAARRRRTLAVAELEAAEAEITAMRHGPGGMMLPGPEFNERSVLNINWSADPGGEARRAAIRDGVVTAKEIAEAIKL